MELITTGTRWPLRHWPLGKHLDAILLNAFPQMPYLYQQPDHHWLKLPIGIGHFTCLGAISLLK